MNKGNWEIVMIFVFACYAMFMAGRAFEDMRLLDQIQRYGVVHLDNHTYQVFGR